MVRNILNRSAINSIGSTNDRGTRLDGLWLRRLSVSCLVGTRHVRSARAGDHPLNPIDLHQSLDVHQPEQPMVQQPQPQERQPQLPVSQPQSSLEAIAMPIPGGMPGTAGGYGQPQGEFAAAAAFTECSRWAPMWAVLVLSRTASADFAHRVESKPAEEASLAAIALIAAGQGSGKRSASS